MHRKVSRPEAAREALQASSADARQHSLQHRRIDSIEDCSLSLVEPGGKGCRVEDDIEGRSPDQGAKRGQRGIVLEARDIDARGREAPARSACASASIGSRSLAR